MRNSRVLTVAFLMLGLFVSAQNTDRQAPQGFDVEKKEIPHGKIDTIQYESKTVGTQRKALIYTPPGFKKGEKYPVLYLLHGIGGDEKEWYNQGKPNVILDNLYAQGKLQPMIVVLPNGRAMKDDRATGNIMAPDKVEAFAIFEKDLLNDLIPFVEKNILSEKTVKVELWRVCRWEADRHRILLSETSINLRGSAHFLQHPTPKNRASFYPIRKMR